MSICEKSGGSSHFEHSPFMSNILEKLIPWKLLKTKMPSKIPAFRLIRYFLDVFDVFRSLTVVDTWRLLAWIRGLNTSGNMIASPLLIVNVKTASCDSPSSR